MEVFKCAICGKERLVPPSVMKTKRTPFCRECFLSKRIIHVVITCEECGKQRTVTKADSLNKEHYTCLHCTSKRVVKFAHEAVKVKGKQSSRINERGYVFILAPEHRLVNSEGFVREHWLVVDSVVGTLFDPKRGHVIHHIDGNPSNNSKENLLLCPNQAYHLLLHRRKKAFQECGYPNKIRCQHCGEYDYKENLLFRGHSILHKECYKEVNRIKCRRKKELKHLNKVAA